MASSVAPSPPRAERGFEEDTTASIIRARGFPPYMDNANPPPPECSTCNNLSPPRHEGRFPAARALADSQRRQLLQLDTIEDRRARRYPETPYGMEADGVLPPRRFVNGAGASELEEGNEWHSDPMFPPPPATVAALFGREQSSQIVAEGDVLVVTVHSLKRPRAAASHNVCLAVQLGVFEGRTAAVQVPPHHDGEGVSPGVSPGSGKSAMGNVFALEEQFEIPVECGEDPLVLQLLDLSVPQQRAPGPFISGNTVPFRQIAACRADHEIVPLLCADDLASSSTAGESADDLSGNGSSNTKASAYFGDVVVSWRLEHRAPPAAAATEQGSSPAAVASSKQSTTGDASPVKLRQPVVLALCVRKLRLYCESSAVPDANKDVPSITCVARDPVVDDQKTTDNADGDGVDASAGAAELCLMPEQGTRFGRDHPTYAGGRVGVYLPKASDPQEDGTNNAPASTAASATGGGAPLVVQTASRFVQLLVCVPAAADAADSNDADADPDVNDDADGGQTLSVLSALDLDVARMNSKGCATLLLRARPSDDDESPASDHQQPYVGEVVLEWAVTLSRQTTSSSADEQNVSQQNGILVRADNEEEDVAAGAPTTPGLHLVVVRGVELLDCDGKRQPLRCPSVSVAVGDLEAHTQARAPLDAGDVVWTQEMVFPEVPVPVPHHQRRPSKADKEQAGGEANAEGAALVEVFVYDQDPPTGDGNDATPTTNDSAEKEEDRRLVSVGHTWLDHVDGVRVVTVAAAPQAQGGSSETQPQEPQPLLGQVILEYVFVPPAQKKRGEEHSGIVEAIIDKIRPHRAHHNVDEEEKAATEEEVQPAQEEEKRQSESPINDATADDLPADEKVEEEPEPPAAATATEEEKDPADETVEEEPAAAATPDAVTEEAAPQEPAATEEEKDPDGVTEEAAPHVEDEAEDMKEVDDVDEEAPASTSRDAEADEGESKEKKRQTPEQEEEQQEAQEEENAEDGNEDAVASPPSPPELRSQTDTEAFQGEQQQQPTIDTQRQQQQEETFTPASSQSTSSPPIHFAPTSAMCNSGGDFSKSGEDTEAIEAIVNDLKSTITLSPQRPKSPVVVTTTSPPPPQKKKKSIHFAANPDGSIAFFRGPPAPQHANSASRETINERTPPPENGPLDEAQLYGGQPSKWGTDESPAAVHVRDAEAAAKRRLDEELGFDTRGGGSRLSSSRSRRINNHPGPSQMQTPWFPPGASTSDEHVPWDKRRSVRMAQEQLRLLETEDRAIAAENRRRRRAARDRSTSAERDVSIGPRTWSPPPCHNRGSL